MPTISTLYKGNLRTEAIHVKSGNKLVTDAPTDNNGKGETFSPTDLLAASLGSCMLTIMGIVAEKNNIDIENTNVETIKIMGENPRKVQKIEITISMPHNNYSEKEKKLLYNAAVNCPVAKSLNQNLIQEITITYPK